MSFSWKITLVSIITHSYAQESLCIWDNNDWSGVNGVYTYAGQHDGYNYWEIASMPSECSIFMKWGPTIGWEISSTLDGDALTMCQDTIQPSHPSNCTSWSPITISVTKSASCPIVPCNYIDLTEAAGCTDIYQKDPLYPSNNVYISITSWTPTYLYFNERNFAWYCSNTYDTDCIVEDFIIDSNTPQWLNLTTGVQTDWIVSGPRTAYMTCLDNTLIPYTMSPTSPTNIPSISPTYIPTISPSESTNSPTFNPITKQPTNNITPNPTTSPLTINTNLVTQLITDDNNDNKKTDDGVLGPLGIEELVYMAIGGFLFLIIFLILCYCFGKRSKTKKTSTGSPTVSPNLPTLAANADNPNPPDTVSKLQFQTIEILDKKKSNRRISTTDSMENMYSKPHNNLNASVDPVKLTPDGEDNGGDYNIMQTPKGGAQEGGGDDIEDMYINGTAGPN